MISIPRGGTAVECNECSGGEAWGHRCGTCNGGGYVVTENEMERDWTEIAETALEIADVAMTADTQLGLAADRLQSLIAQAADTPHDDDERKKNMLAVWRATLDCIRNAQAALVGRKAVP